MYNTPIEIIGVPLDFGASRRGTDAGPSALRIAGLHQSLTNIGYRIAQDIDISVPSRQQVDFGEQRMRYKSAILDTCIDLAEKTYRALQHGHTPLILGGDHSVAMGSVAGVAAHFRKKQQHIGLLWFDAHADINTPQTSTSGNIHGMPLAHLLGFGDRELASILGPGPKIRADNVALVGVRDVDRAEQEIIQHAGIHVFTMRDIDERGMGKVSEEAIACITNHTDGFHVSFDVDGCDPEVIPGTGTLVPGGTSYREAHLLLEKCADTGKMCSMDLVELNPFLDNKNVSAERAVHLIRSAFDHSILT